MGEIKGIDFFKTKEEEKEALKWILSASAEDVRKEWEYSKSLDTGTERDLVHSELKLSVADQKILAYVEQVFWDEGCIPTAERISQRLGYRLDFTERQLARRSTFAAMLRLGLPVHTVMTDEGLRASLTPTQLQLANMLMNALDRRSVREKLEICDVTPMQYERWIRQPAFQSYLRKRAETVFAGSDHKAYLALLAAVDRGDLNAIKLFFEMRGIYNPKLDVKFSIDGMLNQIIEVVSRHVTPEQLEQIANEIEGLTQGAVVGKVNPKFEQIAIEVESASGR